MLFERALQFRSTIARADRATRSGAFFVRWERKKRAAPRGEDAQKRKNRERDDIESARCVPARFFCPPGEGRGFTPAPLRIHRTKKERADAGIDSFLVGEGGFEPPKSLTTDLQSAPFGHSGIPPYSLVRGAGRRIRTPDLLITNQLLYQLSYTSISATNKTYVSRLCSVCQEKISKKEEISWTKEYGGAQRCKRACRGRSVRSARRRSCPASGCGIAAGRPPAPTASRPLRAKRSDPLNTYWERSAGYDAL